MLGGYQRFVQVCQGSPGVTVLADALTGLFPPLFTVCCINPPVYSEGREEYLQPGSYSKECGEKQPGIYPKESGDLETCGS